MRSRFETNLDDINDLNLKQNPEVEPEYQLYRPLTLYIITSYALVIRLTPVVFLK